MFSKKKPQPPERSTRTMPTVRSNAVFSYHANRSIRGGMQQRDNSREEKPVARLKTPYWRRRLPNIATLVTAALILLLCLQLGNNVVVETVGASQGHVFLRDKQVYAQAASEAFKSLANSNKLTVNTAKISSDLKKQFPELQAVSISLPLIGNRPTVYLQPASPKLILISKGGMHVLDGQGRALLPANQVAKLQDLGLPVVTDQSNFIVESGQIVLPRDTIAFISEVVGQLSGKQVKVASLSLPPGTNELHLKIQGAGYTVKFNLRGNAREETGSFLAVKKYLEGQRRLPREYIDVRVENKAFYK